MSDVRVIPFGDAVLHDVQVRCGNAMGWAPLVRAEINETAVILYIDALRGSFGFLDHMEQEPMTWVFAAAEGTWYADALQTPPVVDVAPYDDPGSLPGEGVEGLFVFSELQLCGPVTGLTWVPREDEDTPTTVTTVPHTSQPRRSRRLELD